MVRKNDLEGVIDLNSVAKEHGVPTDIAALSLKTVGENIASFQPGWVNTTILALDLIGSEKLADFGDSPEGHHYDYAELVNNLRAEWAKIYDHFGGLKVKDIGDAEIVDFDKNTLNAVLAADMAHKVTENYTFRFIVRGISKKFRIKAENTEKYLTTQQKDCENDIEKRKWKKVNDEYKKVERVLGPKLQIKAAVYKGRVHRSYDLTSRDLNGPAMTRVCRMYDQAGAGNIFIGKDVYNEVKDRVYSLDMGVHTIDKKSFSEHLFSIPSIKKYEADDFDGLAPQGSVFHSMLPELREWVDDVLALLKDYQTGGMEIDPITGEPFESFPKNLILNSFDYELSDRYNPERSIFTMATADALAQALIEMGKEDTENALLTEETYTDQQMIKGKSGEYSRGSFRENLGLTSSLAGLGTYQSKQLISGQYRNYPRKLSRAQVEQLNEEKARHNAVATDYCLPIRIREIDPLLRFQHAWFDGSHASTQTYKRLGEGFRGVDFSDTENLVGKDIPLILRILQVANGIVLHNTPQAYELGRIIPKDPKDLLEKSKSALDHLEQWSGKIYDPKIVAAYKFLIQKAN